MLEKHVKAELILETGKRFDCYTFGHIHETIGRVVFCTSMAGYQELLTNPVYAGYLVVLTNPLIGNSGINFEDYESGKIWLNGLIMRENCTYPSNWRFEMNLEAFLKEYGAMAVEGIDTRALTRHIRDTNEMLGLIAMREDRLTQSQIDAKFKQFMEQNEVATVSTKSIYEAGTGEKVAVLDLGVRRSILGALTIRGLSATVFPWDTPAHEILAHQPKGLLISGGPGNPNDLPQVVETISSLAGQLPLLGVGLGGQLLCLAFGGAVEKLPYGCHGDNFPLKESTTGRVYTTSQSRSYDITALPKGAQVLYTNVNKQTIDGFALPKHAATALQFYPDAHTMPYNTGKLYDAFAKQVKGGGLNA